MPDLELLQVVTLCDFPMLRRCFRVPQLDCPALRFASEAPPLCAPPLRRQAERKSSDTPSLPSSSRQAGTQVRSRIATPHLEPPSISQDLERAKGSLLPMHCYGHHPSQAAGRRSSRVGKAFLLNLNIAPFAATTTGGQRAQERALDDGEDSRVEDR